MLEDKSPIAPVTGEPDSIVDDPNPPGSSRAYFGHEKESLFTDDDSLALSIPNDDTDIDDL
jgi:hypothetical protein